MECSVVIDCGSAYARVGFAGSDIPLELPNIVGRLRFPRGMMIKETFVGEDAQERRGILTLKYPVENGIVTIWDDMEEVYHYIFENKLCVESEDSTVLLSEATFNVKSNREKMTELMFETFKTKGMFAAMKPALSLAYSGRNTGLVVQSGSAGVNIVPIYNGSILSECVRRVNTLGGRSLTRYLERILTTYGYCFSTTAEREIVRNIKEQFCAVALDPEYTENLTDQIYELPDGQVIEFNRFKCLEGLFNSRLLGSKCGGIQLYINSSLRSCDADKRELLANNILLAGGNTMFPGLDDRLTKELIKDEQFFNINYKFLAPPINRAHSAWLGGSMVASYSNYAQKCISKEEYEEIGATIIHTKCRSDLNITKPPKSAMK